MASGTSFWKVFFAVLGGLLVAGGCLAGACVFLVGRAAVKVNEAQQEVRKAQEERRTSYIPFLDVDLTETFTRGEWAYVRGKVKNTGDKTVRYWKVRMVYLDLQGETIDTGYTNSLETLRPGETKRFELMKRKDPKVHSARPQLEEVRLVDE